MADWRGDRSDLVPVEPGASWLEEPESPGQRWRARRGAAVVLALSLSAVGLTAVALRSPSSKSDGKPPIVDNHISPDRVVTPAVIDNAPAHAQVLAALGTTNNSGGFTYTFRLSETLGRRDAPQSCAQHWSSSTGSSTSGSAKAGWSTAGSSTMGGNGPPSPGPSYERPCFKSGSPVETVTGAGSVNTNPYASVGSAHLAAANFDVTIRENTTTLWEYGGADYGLEPQSRSAGPGGPISGFAGLTEGSLGAREGALAMLSLASPSGYLDLTQSSFTGVTVAGKSTVDGVAVTLYNVTVNPAKLGGTPGISSEQAKTIADAVTVLEREGFTKTTETVALDDAGFIRQGVAVAHFSDGGTVTDDTKFSGFGCVGSVLMPGQSAGVTSASTCASLHVKTPPTSPAPQVPTTPAPKSTATTPARLGYTSTTGSTTTRQP